MSPVIWVTLSHWPADVHVFDETSIATIEVALVGLLLVVKRRWCT
jgi:hypothetical protein